jgi:hypothetical protein
VLLYLLEQSAEFVGEKFAFPFFDGLLEAV